MVRTPNPPEKPPTFTLNKKAYEVAKAKSGLKYDQTVADALGVHPVTWSRILSGKYILTEAKAAALRRVFPDDYDAIVTTHVPEVVDDASAV